MSSFPTWLLITLIVVAVGAGLYIGHRAGALAPGEERAPRKSLGSRARDAATRGIVSMWKWNRARKKKAKERERA
jgi:hypothetical protein